MNSESKLILLIIKQVVYGGDKKELENLIEARHYYNGGQRLSANVLVADASRKPRVLARGNSLVINGVNWDRVKDLITYHELAPFAYSTLKDLDCYLPQDFREFLNNSYYYTLFRQLTFESEFLKIAKAFEEKRVDIVPIKGMALIQDVYLEKPPRPMVDIDLLVKEEDIEKSEVVFNDLGYKKDLLGLKEEYWRYGKCQFSFYKKEDKRLPLVELHWNLDFRSLDLKRKNRVVLPDLWHRIRKVNIDGRTVKIPSPEDTLFILSLHQRHYGWVLSLKSVLDLGLLLNMYRSSFDWDYVLKESQRGQMNSTVFYLLYSASIFLDSDIPKDVWTGLKIPFWKRKLVQNFVEKNTFRQRNININKNLYLKSHFLLYNTIWEPIEYIINIPKEEFAGFYNLKPYDKKTKFLYKNRLFYMPLKSFLGAID
jgi:hypothetical protein